MRQQFKALLRAAQSLHESREATLNFCPFPQLDNVSWRSKSHNSSPATKLMIHDDIMQSNALLTKEVMDVCPFAAWIRSYQGTPLGADFRANFCSFELFGSDGHFHTADNRCFIAYCGPHFHYAHHFHPAEELYFVLAGEATFEKEGSRAARLSAGDAIFHAANQSHAMTTQESGVLVYILWRGDMVEAPQWSNTAAKSDCNQMDQDQHKAFR